MDTGDNDILDLVKTATLPSVAAQTARSLSAPSKRDLDVPRAPAKVRPGAEFCWQGNDEGDSVCGRGWVTLAPLAVSSAISISTKARLSLRRQSRLFKQPARPSYAFPSAILLPGRRRSRR